MDTMKFVLTGLRNTNGKFWTEIDCWFRNLENAIGSWFDNPPTLPARPKAAVLPNSGVDKNKSS